MTNAFNVVLFFIFTMATLTQKDIVAQNSFFIKTGVVSFESNAPQENIHAESNKLSGLLNTDQNTFAFSLNIRSFKGFNNPLQQEHFYENYMEYALFPQSTFSGKLIDKFDRDLKSQKLRAKGQLEIHGVKKERIIEVIITKSGITYEIESDFNVLLADHNISIPKIVFQKIAENIKVKVKGELANN